MTFKKLLVKKNLLNPDLICIFVRLISPDEEKRDDEFYIVRLGDLQKIIFENYCQHLEKVNPRKNNSTHVTVNPENLKKNDGKFESNWDLITNRQ